MNTKSNEEEEGEEEEMSYEEFIDLIRDRVVQSVEREQELEEEVIELI